MFLSLKHFGSTSVIKCVNGLHRWRNVLLYSDILFILGIFFQLKHNNLFNNQWAEYIIWSPESCLWVTWLFFTSLGKLWQWALSLCWRSGSVWGISFILSLLFVYLFFIFAAFSRVKLFFFFFFLAFHVFIQVDGFAAIENFLPICITVWSVLLYVCKVLLYNGALSHSLQPTCCCSVPLSHVVRRSIGAKSAIMRGAVFAQTCTFSWTRATYTWILLL